LWEPHVSDEYAIAHLRVSLLVLEEKEVLGVDLETLLWKLSAVLAMFLDNHLLACHTL